MNYVHSAITAVGLLLLSGCAAMHAQQVANMKAAGDPRAPCYEACEASDMSCMQACDAKHPLAGTVLQGVGTGGAGTASAPASSESSSSSAQSGFDQQATMQLLAAAAQQDAARKQQQQNALAGNTTSETPYIPASSPRPRPTAPSAATLSETAKKCVTYLKGTKQCVPGGKCYTVEQDRTECR